MCGLLESDEKQLSYTSLKSTESAVNSEKNQVTVFWRFQSKIT